MPVSILQISDSKTDDEFEKKQHDDNIQGIWDTQGAAKLAVLKDKDSTGADLDGGCRGCAPPPEMTCGFVIQLVFCKKRKAIWFIGVEVEQETRLKNLC